MMCCGNEAGNLVLHRSLQCDRVSMSVTCFPIRVHCHLVELCDDGVMRVQHVRKWCRHLIRLQFSGSVPLLVPGCPHGLGSDSFTLCAISQ